MLIIILCLFCIAWSSIVFFTYDEYYYKLPNYLPKWGKKFWISVFFLSYIVFIITLLSF